MKKTFQVIIKKLFLFILLGCLFLFNFSCGLDNFEVFESPEQVIHLPEASRQNVSFDEAFFEFFTNEPTVPYSTITFLGTDVYYKIYNSFTQLEAEIQTLNSLATSTENSNNAFNKMADSDLQNSTSGYGYKRLIAEGYESREILIPYTGRNQDIKIRLSDYGSILDYASRIMVDDGNYFDSTSMVKPIRNVSLEENKTVSFNFGRYEDEIVGGRNVYNGTDGDVRNSSDSSVVPGEWYVAMYAVAVARGMDWGHQYSNILYLGNVKITTAKDN